MKRFLSNLRTDIIWCIFVFAVAAVALYIAGFKFYIVMSGSMEPEIATGSVIFVASSADFDDVVAGDVICYRSESGAMVSHRAITVTEDGIETKGDANRISDGISVTEDNFIGTEVFSIPYLGYVITELKKPANIIILIALILMIYILSLVRKDRSRKPEIQNRQDVT